MNIFLFKFTISTSVWPSRLIYQTPPEVTGEETIPGQEIGRDNLPETKEKISPQPEIVLEQYRQLPEFQKENQVKLNSLQTFSKLSQVFIDTRITAEMEKRGEITILYPASGSHIAPLEIGLDILEKKKKIQTVNYIYTEIDSSKLDDLKKSLNALYEAGLFTSFKMQSIPGIKTGKEILFTMGYKTKGGEGKTITLRFALKRSKKALYRDQYFDKADIFVCHDPTDDNMDQGINNALDAFLESSRKAPTAKPRTMFLENLDNSYAWNLFEGRTDKVQGGYGCRYGSTEAKQGDHLGHPMFGAALLFSPDEKIIRSFSHKQLESFTDLMRSAKPESSWDFTDYKESVDIIKDAASILKQVHGKNDHLVSKIQNALLQFLSHTMSPSNFDDAILKFEKARLRDELLKLVEYFLDNQNDPTLHSKDLLMDVEEMSDLIGGKKDLHGSSHSSVFYMNNLMSAYRIIERYHDAKLQQKFEALFRQKFAFLLTQDEHKQAEMEALLKVVINEHLGQTKTYDLRDPKKDGNDMGFHLDADPSGMKSGIGDCFLKMITVYIYLCRKLKIPEAAKLLQKVKISLMPKDEVTKDQRISDANRLTPRNFVIEYIDMYFAKP